MKAIVLLLATLGFLTLQAQYKPLEFSVDTLSIDEVSKNIGSYKVVCGSVSSVSLSPTSIESVYLIGVGTPAKLYLQVWESDASRWHEQPPKWLPVGTEVCVQGQLTTYGSSPRMEIGNQGQIHRSDN